MADSCSKVDSKYTLPIRSGNFNNLGREVNVTLNTFDVKKTPTVKVQQYDLTIIDDKGVAASRIASQKVFKSKALTSALGKAPWLVWSLLVSVITANGDLV